MDSYKSYTDQVLQISPVVIGMKLLPFTLGHSLLLKQAKSIFVSSGKKLNDHDLISELIFAVMVCSTTHDEFLEEVRTGNYQKELQELIQRIKDAKHINVIIEIQKLQHYIKEGTTPPYYYATKTQSESNISTNPISIEHSIKSVLMTECNYTRQECLDLPYNEILADFLLYAHKQEKIEIISKEIFDLKESLKNKTK